MTQKIRGRHRRQGQRAAVMGALPIAIAISYSSVAVAAPQPGLTDEVQPDENPAPTTAQPGFTDEADSDDSDAESDKVAPSTERAEVSEPKSYWVAPPVEYNNVPTRELPTYYEYDEQDEEYVAPEPVQAQDLHLPTAVDPVAPIEAPEDKLRIGDYITEKPDWLSEEHMEKTNNSAAVVEAQVATFWNSVGIDTSRSDRLAAATTAGALAGIGVGAVGCGVPAAVVGGLAGGTVGGLIGSPAFAASINPLWAPILVPAGTVATVGGAAIGAAAAGIPAAAVCGTVGGLAGGAIGATFGAGDETIAPTVEHDQGVAPVLPDMPAETDEADEKAAPEAAEEEAAPAPEAPAVEAPPAPPAPPVEAAPQAPGFDTQMIANGADQVIAQVQTLPGGAALADNLTSFVDAVPQLVDNTNDYAAEQGETLRESGVEVPTLV